MAIRQGNFPYRIPYPTRSGLSQYGGSLFGKIIVSADTTLVVDTDDEFKYNLLVNDSADADTDLDIPCFILPSGTIIEDIGIHRFQATTAAAHFILGDTADSDGWMDTVQFATASGTDAIGIINWAAGGLSARMFATTGSDDPALASTLTIPARVGFGPREWYSDSAYSTTLVVGLDSDDEPRPHEYAIHIHQKEAVAVTGGMSVYIKYNLAGLQIREPSSNLGDTGD